MATLLELSSFCRSFQFHGTQNSVMSVCPSWPIMYKPRHIEGVSVEIRASEGNCQIVIVISVGFLLALYQSLCHFSYMKHPENYSISGIVT